MQTIANSRPMKSKDEGGRQKDERKAKSSVAQSFTSAFILAFPSPVVKIMRREFKGALPGSSCHRLLFRV
jgi:hypothetical protein